MSLKISQASFYNIGVVSWNQWNVKKFPLRVDFHKASQGTAIMLALSLNYHMKYPISLPYLQSHLLHSRDANPSGLQTVSVLLQRVNILS